MKRYLYRDIKSLALDRNKMVFISGPRQVGKTTLAKSLVSEYDQAVYKNWDESQFRKLWVKDPNNLKELFHLAEVA
ncbi:MAG: AAA family ATPase [Pseudobdellovibrio sp.]